MYLSRLLPKTVVISITAGAIVASALGFRDQLPPSVRDLVPSINEAATLLQTHSRGVISRVKGVAPESTDAY